MTVPNQSIRNDATGTGSTGPFTFNFPILDISTLLVISTDLLGNDTILVRNVDYTVVGAKSANDYSLGGTITLTNPLTTGYHLAMLSNLAGTQATSIRNNRFYYADLHENEFDLLSVFDLQVLEKLNKGLIAPDSEPAGTASLRLPPITKRASQVLGFDANGAVSMVAGPLLLMGVSNPQKGDILEWDGTKWVNQAGNYQHAEIDVAVTPPGGSTAGWWITEGLFLNLPSGTWDIWGTGFWGGMLAGDLIGWAYASSDGINGITSPGNILTAPGVTAKCAGQFTLGGANGGSNAIRTAVAGSNGIAAPHIILALSQTTKIYFVPYVKAATPGGVSIGGELNAKLLTVAVS